MSKKLFITGLVAMVIVTSVAMAKLPKNGTVASAPTFGDIIAQAQAASADYFLKLDGIDGESTDESHKGEIDVMSWSWGETQIGTSAGGGGGAGKVSMQDVHFTMSMGKATPKLMLAVAKGEHIRDAIITARKGSGREAREYLVIKLENVMVSSYQTGASSGQLPTEQVSLNFAKIQWTHTADDGTVQTGGWDVEGNTEI